MPGENVTSLRAFVHSDADGTLCTVSGSPLGSFSGWGEYAAGVTRPGSRPLPSEKSHPGSVHVVFEPPKPVPAHPPRASIVPVVPDGSARTVGTASGVSIWTFEFEKMLPSTFHA